LFPSRKREGNKPRPAWRLVRRQTDIPRHGNPPAPEAGGAGSAAAIV